MNNLPGTCLLFTVMPFVAISQAAPGIEPNGLPSKAVLASNTYIIDAEFAAAHADGTSLETRPGSVGTLADNGGGAWNLGNSTVLFNGGGMVWTYDATNFPEATFHADDIRIGNATTTLEINTPSGLAAPGGAIPIDGVSLFALQIDTGVGDNLLLATSNTDLSGIAVNNLKLVVKAGGVIQDGSFQQAVTQHGRDVATGAFDYGVVARGNNLEVGYILKKLEIEAGETLQVHRSYGDVQNIDVEITDKAPGQAGHVEFGDFSSNPAPGSPGSTGILLNARNSYTGDTVLRESTTLIMGQDFALGSETAHTANVIMGGSSGYDTLLSKIELAGTNQIIGALNITAGYLDMAGNGSATGGTLTITGEGNGGVSTVAGDNALRSSAAGGRLIVQAGRLRVTGANAAFTGLTDIKGGAAVELNRVDGLGSGPILIGNGGTLRLDVGSNGPSAQVFAAGIEGEGDLVINTAPDAPVSITRANADFRGTTLVEQSRLDVFDAKGVGQSAINVQGSNARYVWNSITSSALDNTTTGDGTIVYCHTNATVNGSQTASRYLIEDGSVITLGDGAVFGSATSLAVVDQTSTLQTNSEVAASVDNHGLVLLAAGGTSLGGYAGYGGVTRFAGQGPLTVRGDLSGTHVLDGIEGDFSQNAVNRISVEGNLSGRYAILATHTGAAATLTQRSRITDFITFGTQEGDHVYDFRMDNTGPYEFSLVRNRAGNGYDIAVAGWSPSGQVLINTIGSMSMGWFTQMDSLVQRMGELRIDRRENGAGDFWVRGYGQQANVDLGVAGVGRFKDYQYGSDIGCDRIFALDDRNRLALGLFAGYQASDRRMHDEIGSHSESNGVAFGAYSTWLHDRGWYADLVVKGQYWDSTFGSFDEKADFTNWGLGVSLEAGRQFVSDRGWFVEPGVQAAWLHLFSNSFETRRRDGRGSYHTSTSGADIMRFRGLVRAGRNLSWNDHLIQPYVKGGVETQASTGGGMTLSDTSIRPDTDATRGVFGAGAIWQLRGGSQIHVDYEGSFGGKYDIPWRATLGYRYAF